MAFPRGAFGLMYQASVAFERFSTILDQNLRTFMKMYCSKPQRSSIKRARSPEQYGPGVQEERSCTDK